MNIFIFTWNTQSVGYTASNAHFIEQLIQKITCKYHDLVIIGLQEDSMRDSDLLDGEKIMVSKLAEAGFNPIDIISLSGWGSTTFKALVNDWNYKPRGLRLALFKNCTSTINIESVKSRTVVCPSWYNWLTNGKGGAIITIGTNIGTVTFLNMHLPFDSSSLIKGNDRSSALMWQIKCFNYMCMQALQDNTSDYLFAFGDLNFRNQLRYESGAAQVAEKLDNVQYLYELISEADELKLMLNYDQTNTFREGVHNIGPYFSPTCKLVKGREWTDTRMNYMLGSKDHRVPSWCDRILYACLKDTGHIVCTSYTGWDHYSMAQSDHASVIGSYSLY